MGSSYAYVALVSEKSKVSINGTPLCLNYKFKHRHAQLKKEQ